MNAYLIESLAPLVFRAGKPFGSQASAQDAIFPLPSTGAGLIRYLAVAQKNKERVFSENWKDVNHQNLLKLQCYGVYLAQFSDDKNPTIFVPKPANSLCLEDEGKTKLVRLAPKSFDEDCGSDLPNGLLYIRTVNEKGEPIEVKGKPKDTVHYWRLEDVIKWQNGEKLEYDTIAKNGLKSIPTEIRTHNSIDSETRSVKDGDLFQTASFDLGYLRKKSENPEINPFDYFDNQRLGFVVFSDEPLKNDWATLGGERRLSYLKKLDNQTLLSKPTIDEINQKGGFSLTFISPAIFAQGYLPSWIDKNTLMGILPNSQTKVRLKAVAVERYQAVSGWDSVKWQPKATRKAVSAGAVYWFELVDGSMLDKKGLEFLTQPLSDNAYDKADGFGMALVSAWQAV